MNGHQKSANESYKHHKVFHQYKLDDFKEHDKNIAEFNIKHREELKWDMKLLKRYFANSTKRSVTRQGKTLLGWSSCIDTPLVRELPRLMCVSFYCPTSPASLSIFCQLYDLRYNINGPLPRVILAINYDPPDIDHVTCLSDSTKKSLCRLQNKNNVLGRVLN